MKVRINKNDIGRLFPSSVEVSFLPKYIIIDAEPVSSEGECACDGKDKCAYHGADMVPVIASLNHRPSEAPKAGECVGNCPNVCKVHMGRFTYCDNPGCLCHKSAYSGKIDFDGSYTHRPSKPATEGKCMCDYMNDQGPALWLCRIHGRQERPSTPARKRIEEIALPTEMPRGRAAIETASADILGAGILKINEIIRHLNGDDRKI
jgi:hypothetical protein